MAALGATVRYRSRRRWPGPTPVTSAITVEVGPALGSEELGEFDHYLTARWQLYTILGPLLARASVEHEPWPLHRAAVRELAPTWSPRPACPPLPPTRWSTGHRGCEPG